MNLDTVKDLNIAIYTRVSTEDQAKEGFSLESQLERLRAFCVARRWNIAGEYIDAGYSGRNTKRPRYQQMLKESHIWDGVLVIKMDRIHRNRSNFIDMMEGLKKQEKQFISMSESLDTTTAMGRFVMGIIQDIAQLESEQLGERTFLGMRQKAKQRDSGFIGGGVPFGFNLKDHKLIPIPSDLEIVKQIFNLYNKGLSIPRVSKKLDMKYATVHYILKNPIYAGFHKWHNIVKRADIEPVISITLWNLTQRKKAVTCNQYSHRVKPRYKPLILSEDKDYYEIAIEKIKAMPAVHRAKHNLI